MRVFMDTVWNTDPGTKEAWQEAKQPALRAVNMYRITPRPTQYAIDMKIFKKFKTIVRLYQHSKIFKR
jgi:cephalosporin hydroxylase